MEKNFPPALLLPRGENITPSVLQDETKERMLQTILLIGFFGFGNRLQAFHSLGLQIF